MEAGTHKYPFSFTLPPNVPSSFEGYYGHVRYTAKATMDRPWKFDHDTRSAFTVISLVDLNLEHPQFRVTSLIYVKGWEQGCRSVVKIGGPKFLFRSSLFPLFTLPPLPLS